MNADPDIAVRFELFSAESRKQHENCAMTKIAKGEKVVNDE